MTMHHVLDVSHYFFTCCSRIMTPLRHYCTLKVQGSSQCSDAQQHNQHGIQQDVLFSSVIFVSNLNEDCAWRTTFQ